MKRITLVASIIGACAIAAIVPGTVIGVMNSSVVTNNNSSNENKPTVPNEPNKPSEPDKPSTPEEPSLPDNQSNSIFSYNISDIVDDSTSINIIYENVMEKFKNSIENFSEFQQKQFVINSLCTAFYFAEDLPTNVQTTIQIPKLKKDNISGIKNIELINNSLKLYLNDLLYGKKLLNLFNIIEYNQQTFYPSIQISGKNQYIEFVYGNTNKKNNKQDEITEKQNVGFIKNKVFNNIDEANEYVNTLNKENVSSYFVYITNKENNDKCNLYWLPNYKKDSNETINKSTFSLKFFLTTDSSPADDGKSQGTGMPMVMKPMLIPGKFIIEN